jgi:hypothetical protein
VSDALKSVAKQPNQAKKNDEAKKAKEKNTVKNSADEKSRKVFFGV